MCSPQGKSSGNYPDLSDVGPISVPCDGIGYKAPFRMEAPFQLTFIVQWYMEKAELEKRFLLSYYDFDDTIELKDIDRHQHFLRRMRIDTVKKSELFLGNKLLILARQIVILDYGDDFTRQYCNPKCERAFILVRPEAMGNLPNIIHRIEKCFRILRGKIVIMPQTMAYEYSDDYQGEENFIEAVRSLDGKPVAAFLLMAENALEKVKNLVGFDLDPKEAMLKNHQSLRALYGIDPLRNGFFYSETSDCAIQLASKFFSEHPGCNLPSYSLINGCTTCCIIKPHIMREGRAGITLSDIVASGFQIIGMCVCWLNKRQVVEFYELYKRIYAEAEFMEMVDELSVGPCMVVELASCHENTAEMFRCICGPSDSDLARKVRPQTIRAKHGLNKIQNAVHCTDLAEDVISELEYFFLVLDRKAQGIKSVTGTGSLSYS